MSYDGKINEASKAEADPGPAFRRLYDIMVRLRSPQGCPWDREQTPRSIRRNLLEETYECIEAIEDDSPAEIAEELGDVFLLVTMLSRMYEESGEFRVVDVLTGLCEKLVRRHPHVFGEAQAATADEVVDQWRRIKSEQEGKPEASGLLDKVSRGRPAVERANELQKAAAKAGFDWPALGGVREKVLEELSEVVDQAGGDEAMELSRSQFADASDELEDEVGDLLFSVVNFARYLGVDPSVALNRANTKFTKRFREVERRMAELGRRMEAAELGAMDALWDEAKASQRGMI